HPVLTLPRRPDRSGLLRRAAHQGAAPLQGRPRLRADGAGAGSDGLNRLTAKTPRSPRKTKIRRHRRSPALPFLSLSSLAILASWRFVRLLLHGQPLHRVDDHVAVRVLV